MNTRRITRLNFLVATALLWLTAGCGGTISSSSSSSTTVSPSASISSTPLVLAIDLPVEGMTCSGCEETIRMAVERLPGVKSCHCDHKAKSAHVVFDVGLVGKTRIVSTIRETGYEVPIVDEGGCSAVEPDAAKDAH